MQAVKGSQQNKPREATMGAGGRMTTKDINNAEKLRRAPTDKPPFTISELKKAIPPHCFRRSILRSSSYLVYDLAIASALLYLALYQIPALPSPARYLAWPLYWFSQGTVLAGVWNIGHECGHYLFSDYRLLDNVVGFILHSALFVPFFAWKYTHSRHHIHINSLEKDEAFVPRTKSTLTPYARYLNNPLGRFVVFFVSLTVGWPMYLAFNFTGRPLPGFTSHYDPYGPFYNDGERAQVLLSDAGLLVVCFGLYQLAVKFSIGWVIKIYAVPLLIVNGWLVLVTYLHHTHPSVPRYDSLEWDWLRGALGTVDRDYGIANTVLHNITDAHVVHHLFLTIPHYHAKEATEAIRPLLGEYYQFDRTPIIKALWREAKECLYVESEGGKQKGVYWFNNKL